MQVYIYTHTHVYMAEVSFVTLMSWWGAKMARLTQEEGEDVRHRHQSPDQTQGRVIHCLSYAEDEASTHPGGCSEDTKRKRERRAEKKRE